MVNIYLMNLCERVDLEKRLESTSLTKFGGDEQNAGRLRWIGINGYPCTQSARQGHTASADDPNEAHELYILDLSRAEYCSVQTVVKGQLLDEPGSTHRGGRRFVGMTPFFYTFHHCAMKRIAGVRNILSILPGCLLACD